MTTENDTYILFDLGGTKYGFASREVQQLELVENITPVPNSRPYVEGVTFSQGKLLPVINLRARFGLERISYDITSRLIVVRSGERTVGLIVDSAREFVSITPTAFQDPPEETIGLGGQYLKSIASLNDQLVLILDADAVLQFDEYEQVMDAAGLIDIAGQDR